MEDGRGCNPGGRGAERSRVEVWKRNRPHMVLRSWDLCHVSKMLTQSIERLSTSTYLTDTARLLTCTEALMDMRTEIACRGPLLDATLPNFNQFPLSCVNSPSQCAVFIGSFESNCNMMGGGFQTCYSRDTYLN